MPTSENNKYLDIFEQCVNDVKRGVLIVRPSATDKEFHFQNWFKNRLDAVGHLHDSRGRNSYPDFALVNSAEGFEVKGLAYPGRDATYDSNSQVPVGRHNGRDIYYVFGRYPAKPTEAEYPVVDLIICHGNFLNCDEDYVHDNKSVNGFGSYGDIQIRDRKMYVVPTPYVLTQGTTAQRTLIVPAAFPVDERFVAVGDLVRTEAAHLVVAYQFDLQTNDLSSKRIPNPNAGRQHSFKAYRLVGDNTDVPVSMRSI